jgi:hypothetical protein
MRQLASSSLPPKADYLPVVLVRRNLSTFADSKGIKLEEDVDDFDAYKVARLQLDSDPDCDFLLFRYAGADEGTFDICLSTEVPNPSKCLLDIISELRLDSKDVVFRELNTHAFDRGPQTHLG